MTTQRIGTAICALALTTATFSLAISSATTLNTPQTGYPSAAAAAASTKDGYGLRSPDAIEHWTASLQKKAESAACTIASTKDGYGLRSPDAIEHWTASLQKKCESAACTIASTKDGYGLRSPDAIEHWTASLQKKAESAGCTRALFSQ